jgi:hypothetical protein
MRRLIPGMLPLLLAAALLSGCGGDDGKDAGADASDETTSGSPTDPGSSSTSPPESTDFGAPATGVAVTGTGYSYRLPAGWVDTSKQLKARQKTVDSAGSAKPAAPGFVDNINVGFDSAPGATLDQLQQTVPLQLSTLVKKVETLPLVGVDGVGAIHHRGPAELGDDKYFLEQFVTLDENGDITIITFSLGRDMPARERDRLVGSVMATWRWTG